MRPTCLAITIVSVAGCAAPLALDGARALDRDVRAFGPAPHRVGASLSAAGRHEAHLEQDVGEVTFGDDGTFLNDPVVKRPWRPSFWLLTDINVVTGVVPGIGVAVDWRTNSFGVSTLIGPIESWDKNDNSSTSQHEDWRVVYRRGREGSGAYIETGIAALRARASWTGDSTTVESLHVVLGLGWRGAWSAGSKMFSDASFSVSLGRDIHAAPLVGEAPEVGFDSSVPWVRATLLGVTF